MSSRSTGGSGTLTCTTEEVLDSLFEGVAVFDPDLRLAYINQNARFMLQLRDEQCEGLSLEEAFPPDVAAALAEPLGRALAGEPVLTHEILSRFAEGTEITLGLTISQTPPAPLPPAALVMTARDMSVSREVSRLQDIAQAKEEFFSVVSHELRTPLTSIIAYADTLISGIPATAEERTEFIAIIRSEGERLSRLIDEVLDLSRMEANRLTLHLKELDLRDLVHAAAKGLAASANHSGHVLEISLPATPLLLVGDPERLLQVLVNLLGNSLKFTPAGGHLTIGAAARDRVIEGWVSDTGIGIAPDDLERVFEKFERVDLPGTLVKGTGLGLPITKGLIQRMGGRIWAESTPGNGTTVRFTLPRVRESTGTA